MAVMETCASLMVFMTIATTFLPAIIGQTVCGNYSLLANATEQYITSPGYPNNYPSNTDCHWLITASLPTEVVKLKVLDFELDMNDPMCPYDYLAVYDGNSTGPHNNRLMVCGHYTSTDVLMSNGNAMAIWFHTNGSDNFKGFRLSYTSDDKSVLCSNSTLEAGRYVNYLNSPNYPYMYPPFLDCLWTITADSPVQVIVLNLVTYNADSFLSCPNDYVAIYNGPSTSSPIMQRLCGPITRSRFVSDGPSMTLAFHSHSGGSHMGFQFEYFAKNRSVTCTNSSFVANGSAQYYSLPGDFHNYASFMNCRFTIRTNSLSKRVVITSLNFSVELYGFIDQTNNCIDDYVAIYDGSSTNSLMIHKSCGNDTMAPIISSGAYMTVVLHSAERENLLGFEFGFTSKDNTALCGNRDLEATYFAKSLTSPGYPNSSPSNIVCQWVIEADTYSRVVELKLLEFNVGVSSTYCANDYVTIYDGNITGSPLMQTVCGDLSPSQFISTGRFMTVVFNSGQSKNFKVFRMEYNTRDKSASCAHSYLIASASAQYITSPSYPTNYSSNLNCQWSITPINSSQVVLLKIVYFELEYSNNCSSDYVTILDGNTVKQVLCGHVSSTQFNSSGQHMTVTFNSDWRNNFKGFKFEYTSVNRPDLCSDTSLTATSSMNYFTSVNYPYNYSSNLDCQWTISSDLYTSVVVLSVLYFGLEGPSPSCYNDYVSIHDGIGSDFPVIQKLCGQLPYTQFTSTGSYMTVVFHSDGTENFTGFRFGYITQEKSALCTNTSMTATGSAQYISSPGYPYSYPGNADCHWRIASNIYSDVVVLKLMDFNLEYTSSCTNDYVAIYDGYSTSSPILQKLCGLNSYRQFTSTGSYMTVVFHSDRSNSYKGFKLQYTSETKSAACSFGSLTATTGAVYLTSPNYPSPYPSNIDCQWHISAVYSSGVVVLDLVQFSLKGDGSFCYSSDYVKIYDGASTASSLIKTLCGSQYSGSYRSTGSDMTVVFQSNGGNNYNSGFRFTYKSQDRNTDSRPDNTGLVVAIVVSSIAITCLILVSVICVRRRMAKIQGRGTHNRASRSLARENSLFIVGQGTRGQRATSPNMDLLDSQSMLNPPPYSSLNFDVNDGLPSYADRYPSYNINDLPPPYTVGVSAPLLNGTRPRKSGAGAAQADGAHINGAFNFSDEAVRDERTHQNVSAGSDDSRATNVALSTVIPNAPSSSVA